jgi:hypothetical protein
MSELSESLTSVNDETQADVMDDISQIAELLSESNIKAEQPDDAHEAQPAAEAETDEGEPTASESEATPEDDDAEPPGIDYSMEVPMDTDGEKLTIGALKDHYQATRQFEQERESWEASRVENDQKLLQKSYNLQFLANAIGDVKPEAIQALQAYRSAELQQEKAVLLDLLPDWKQPEKMKADRSELIELVKGYGISEAEFAQVAKAGAVKLLYDFNQLRKREAAARAKLEALQKPAPKQAKSRKTPGPDQQKRAAIERAKNGTEQDKLAAIGALIG